MAGKAGQIIPRGERTSLVRVFMGRDSESGKRKCVNKTIHATLRDAQAYLSRSRRDRDLVFRHGLNRCVAVFWIRPRSCGVLMSGDSGLSSSNHPE
jgi:hypothetical protein